MTKKLLIVTALMLVSLSTYASTLTCKGIDSDNGQITLTIKWANDQMKVHYTDMMTDGYDAQRSWKAESSRFSRTENQINLQATIGDYSWFSLDMNLSSNDGVHYKGESNYEENDSGWELYSKVKDIECIYKK